ncbi:MAG: hypothetical protein ACD_79C01316G0001 [uncultured bacterium]|nr:MAG: hypothetical protein ACD_79C01316G0001 [uncultured bacterium]
MKKITQKKDRKLKPDTNFTPLESDDETEIYQNGIFQFNITKMIEFIKNNPEAFIPEKIEIDDYVNSSVDEDYLDSVKLTAPVILAEIAPEKFNLIDGNHRMEKAKRSGIMHLMAYRLSPPQHIKFLTSQKAYTCYIDYWNDKLKMLAKYKKNA